MTPVKQMRTALSDANRSPQRMSLFLGSPAEPAQLPDLVSLYSRCMSRAGCAPSDELDQDLAVADTALLSYKTELQEGVDRVITQLVVRYREVPSLALALLPDVRNPAPGRPPATQEAPQLGGSFTSGGARSRE
jgi:hypothetical protein